MDEPGSVLLVLGPSTGGIRRHVAALAAGLRTRGWRVEVEGPGPISVRSLAALQRDVDLVHAHGLRAGWLASWVVRRRKPLVVTVHNVILDEAYGRRAPLLRQLERRLPGRVDAVIATSDDVAARFIDAPVGRVSVVRPVGLPPVPRQQRDVTRRAHGVPLDAPLVVTAARLHPQKGLDTLLDAVPFLAARRPGVRIVIVGEGPDEARLRDRLRRERLDGTVRLAGPSPNAADELAAADVVAVPSIWESGPFVLAEAMELGVPVVTTPVGFAPELVDDGVTGRVVPVGDAAALATALGDVLSDPVTAVRLASAGRDRVMAWLDRAGLVDQVIGVYGATLDRQ